jgi:hypothetical protein
MKEVGGGGIFKRLWLLYPILDNLGDGGKNLGGESWKRGGLLQLKNSGIMFRLRYIWEMGSISMSVNTHKICLGHDIFGKNRPNKYERKYA